MNMHHEYLNPFEDQEGFSFTGGHLFTCGDRALMVSHDYGTSILLSMDLVNAIKQRVFPFGLRRKLVQRGFGKVLKSRPVVHDCKEAILPYFFMIDLTRSCALRCKYCFREIKENDSTISAEMLDSICDYIYRYCDKYNRKTVSIQAWGGEPTLAYTRMLQIDDFFKCRNIDARVCMETSGVTLTPNMVREFAKRRFGLGISIDGMPNIHDYHRPLATGHGSWDRVHRGLRILNDNGYAGRFSSIAVVSRRSAPYIKSIVSYFWKELRLPQFKFNVVKCHANMDGDELGLGLDETAQFAKDLFESVVEMYRKGGTAIETNLRTKALNIACRKCSSICLSRGCMGGRKIVSFDSNGNIFTCDLTDAGEKSFGNVSSGDDLVEMLTNASHGHRFFMEKAKLQCQSCPWNFFCRGGCSSSVRFCKGDYTGVDEHECVINHVVYPRLVELLLTDQDLFNMFVRPDVYSNKT